jgi:hypothetical protein
LVLFEAEALVFRVLNVVMAALFGLAVLVQFNDPDPVRWMLIYAVAGAVTASVAAGRRVPLWTPAVVGLIALVWGLRLERLIQGRVAPGELFQSWEMKDERIEVAREAGGLLIVTGWMAVLAAWSWVHGRRSPKLRRNACRIVTRKSAPSG